MSTADGARRITERPLQDRSLSKAKLLTIDLSAACDEIGRSAGAGPGILPLAEEVTTSEEEEEELPKRRRRVVKKKRRVAGIEVEEGALGLRFSANLLLGVARSVLFVSLPDGLLDSLCLIYMSPDSVYDLQVHAASVSHS